jgi:hypothetical protein
MAMAKRFKNISPPPLITIGRMLSDLDFSEKRKKEVIKEQLDIFVRNQKGLH